MILNIYKTPYKIVAEASDHRLVKLTRSNIYMILKKDPPSFWIVTNCGKWKHILDVWNLDYNTSHFRYINKRNEPVKKPTVDIGTSVSGILGTFKTS